MATAVERARDGDEHALRLLFLLYADNVFGYVLSIVGDRHDAEDLTSEVFARLPDALARYRPGASPFTAWLLRVARNAALDHLRARRSVPQAEVHSARGSALQDGERLAGLIAALRKLPADQRQVVVLRLLAGLTPGEVAVRLDRSVDAVHALQYRGRRRLRSELTELGFSPGARGPRAA